MENAELIRENKYLSARNDYGLNARKGYPRIMDEDCGYCVRKQMGWGISKDESWKIVKMIKKTLEENGQ